MWLVWVNSFLLQKRDFKWCDNVMFSLITLNNLKEPTNPKFLQMSTGMFNSLVFIVLPLFTLSLFLVDRNVVPSAKATCYWWREDYNPEPNRSTTVRTTQKSLTSLMVWFSNNMSEIANANIITISCFSYQ